MPITAKKCKHILDDGEPCQAYALKGKQYCFSHDPESREAKAIAVRKGGLVREITIETPLCPIEINEPNGVISLLTQTINEVRAGVLDPRIANTIGYLAGHLIRAFETAQLDRKTEEIRAVIIERTPLKKRG